MGEKGIVSKSYAKTLLKIAGYRNRLVHFYKEITADELYEILQNDLGDIERFSQEIEKFIKKYRRMS
jgi:uncharacterized protein YutE (UPF0331/DUF86 family)